MITYNSNAGFPPNGFQFCDPRITSKYWDDVGMTLRDRIQQVIDFRLANPHKYDVKIEPHWIDPVAVQQEILVYNHARLAGDSRWFRGEPEAIYQQRCCGQPMSPMLCPTCQKPKVIGWKCRKCGNQTLAKAVWIPKEALV